MRKTIHLALAIGAIALLASCAQESIISREYDPDQIAYKAFANNATKSGAVDNDHLGNIGDLYISAIKLNDAGYYFSNNVISSSDVSSSTANSGNTPYYWPAYKLGFYAANRSLVVDNSGTPVLSPYIPNFTVSRSALNAPDELMVALEAQQRDGNGTPVQLGLHHALSRLTIQVQKTIPGYDISVAGVQIGGFKSVGTFTFPQYNTTNAASDADWEGLVSANYGNSNNLHSCWGSLSTPLQYGYLDISSESLSGTAMTSTALNVMDGNYFYVIPQSVTLTTAASGSSPDITSHYIDLLVNVKASASGAQIYPSSSNEDEYAVARVYIPASQTFEAGKSYTITLNLSTGLGVSMSNLSLYNGSSSDLSSSLDSENFVKNVSSEFPDNTFILGTAMDYTASVANWELGPAIMPPTGYGDLVPHGAVPGLFTVNSSGQQVYFSRGNLMVLTDNSITSGRGVDTETNDSGTSGWKFHEHQYDYLGTASITGPWRDDFLWQNDNLYGSFIDFGNNLIFNGLCIDPANTWRCLTGGSEGEYMYLLNFRETDLELAVENARYARGRVANVCGIVLFPDTWVDGRELSSAQKSIFTSSVINNSTASYNYFSISAADWQAYEAAGCVFLPACGMRNFGSVDNLGTGAYYWSSTGLNAYRWYIMEFGPTWTTPDYYLQNKDCYPAVRLVQNK